MCPLRAVTVAISVRMSTLSSVAFGEDNAATSARITPNPAVKISGVEVSFVKSAWSRARIARASALCSNACVSAETSVRSVTVKLFSKFFFLIFFGVI